MRMCLCVLLLLSHNALASARLDFLKVHDGLLIFATHEVKAIMPPNCAEQANNQHWAIPINTPEGRAAHILLITALSANIPVKVLSAGDCAGTDAYERARNVSLVLAD